MPLTTRCGTPARTPFWRARCAKTNDSVAAGAGRGGINWVFTLASFRRVERSTSVGSGRVGGVRCLDTNAVIWNHLK